MRVPAQLRGLVAAAAGIIVLIVAPILAIGGTLIWVHGTIGDLEATLEARLETISRLNAVVVTGRRSVDSTPDTALQVLKADFLRGGEDPIVIAELQNRIRTLAIANNVELNSANALASRTRGALTYLGIHVTMRGQLSELQRVLHALETGTPLLFVERAAIRRDSWPVKSTDPTRDGMPALVAEFDIFGARLPALGEPRAVALTPASNPANAAGPLPQPIAARSGRSAASAPVVVSNPLETRLP